VSPFVTPGPRKRLCRAKAQRNHNPRVGGSSPSSGMRSACTWELFSGSGATKYIPRAPRSARLDLAQLRGLVQASLTIQSPEQSPGVDSERVAPEPHRPPDRDPQMPRSRWLGAASEASRRGLPLASWSRSVDLRSCSSSDAGASAVVCDALASRSWRSPGSEPRVITRAAVRRPRTRTSLRSRSPRPGRTPARVARPCLRPARRPPRTCARSPRA
jgi:hypothetical protein